MKRSTSLRFRELAILLVLIFTTSHLYAQIGIGNTNPNTDALLEIGDATTTTKGLLLPRVNLLATTNPSPLSTDVLGMVVYNKNTAGDVTPGFYYNDGTNWVRLGSGAASNDWSLTGNSGTTSGTGIGENFIGTRDAEDLIIATGQTERVRVLANGQIILNDTGAPIAGDRFTVQGNNNEYAINGYTSGTGSAIYGENATTNGAGVVGNVAVGYGVVGLSTGGGIGVDGENSGDGIGVAGYNTSNGIAVYGWNQGSGNGVRGDAANTNNGVYGQNTGTGSGIYGISNNATGFGMRAANINSTGTGLLVSGTNSTATYLTSGTGIAGNGANGIFGYGRAGGGTGIIGTGNNSTMIVTSSIGSGVAGSGTRNGVFGYAGLGTATLVNRGNSGGTFVLDTDNNTSTNGTNNGTRATAILAGFNNLAASGTGGIPNLPAADSYFGGYFSGGNENNGTPSYAYVGLRHNTNANGNTGTDYKIIGPGNVSTIINDDKGVPRIMFAPEAPEIVFQDYGIGKLTNGYARINIDPILKGSLFVDENHPLKVFVTLEGDCNGVYVTEKSIDGFTVKELKNGTSNVSFSWQIVANRADTKDENGLVSSKHVGLRLPAGPGPLNVSTKQIETLEGSIETLQAKPNSEISKFSAAKTLKTETNSLKADDQN
jgi:hypothetical protein